MPDNARQHPPDTVDAGEERTPSCGCCIYGMALAAYLFIVTLFTLQARWFRITTLLLIIGCGLLYWQTQLLAFLIVGGVLGLLFLLSLLVKVREETPAAEEAEVKAGTVQYALPTCVPIAGPFPVHVQVAMPCTFRTPRRSRLRFNRGWVTVSCAFSTGEAQYYDMPIITSHLAVADEHGVLWQAEGHLLATALVPAWFTEEAKDQQPIPARYFRDIPAAWQEALQLRCLLTGVQAMMDDRIYRYFAVNGQELPIIFKYQQPTFTLAVLPQGEEQGHLFLTLVHGLYDEEAEEVPPLVFTSSPAEILFRNTIGKDDDGAWQLEEVPPLYFTPTSETGTPQPTVVEIASKK